MSFLRRFSLIAVLCALAAMPARAETIRVAVAANLQVTFDPLRQAFKTASGHDAVGVFNSSGRLFSLVRQGAALDVYLSADMAYPEKLVAEGKAIGKPTVFAYAVLVLWSGQKQDLSNWPALLSSEAARKIAITNPRMGLYGEEAMHALKHYGIDARVADKLVYGDGIGQAHQFVQTGAADFGFTTKSLVLASGTSGSWIAVPPMAYTPLAQGAILLARGQREHPAAAQEFIRFLSSPAARSILEQGGYSLP